MPGVNYVAGRAYLIVAEQAWMTRYWLLVNVAD
jgi:hypothetical protein